MAVNDNDPFCKMDNHTILMDTILHRPDQINLSLLYGINQNNINLENGMFAVMLLTIDEVLLEATNSKGQFEHIETDYEIYKKLEYMICNHLERYIHCDIGIIDGRLCCLLQFTREDGSIKWETVSSQIKEICTNVSREFQTSYGYDFSVVLSMPRAGGQHLSDAFQTVNDMLAYQNFMSQPLRFAIEMKSDNVRGCYNRDFPRILEACSQIVVYIQLNESKKAKEYAFSTLDSLFLTTPFSMDGIRVRATTFATVLLQQLLQNSYITTDIIQSEIKVQELFILHSKSKFYHDIEQLIDIAISQLHIDKSAESELAEHIRSYILANFQNVNLNVSMLATTFSLTQPEISVLMKNHTGEALSVYITKIRLQHALEFLEHTDLSLSEIVNRTGFGSLTTLYRAFNKYEHMTPGAYKISHEQNNL